MLDKISKLLKNKELFDKTRFEYVQAIIQMEIENLISKEEQSKITEVVDMTPQAEKLISQAISEVHRKSVHEARIDGMKEGKEEIAKNLKDLMDDEEISRISGLSLERVKQL
jgi:ribonuclease HII